MAVEHALFREFFLEPALSVCAKPRRRTGMRAVALPRYFIVPPCRRGRARRHSGRMILIESDRGASPLCAPANCSAPIRDAAIEDGRNGALEIGRPIQRQWCYGRSLSISALSAASIVRYDASTAITRDPASAIQPVWPTCSISAHCSESSRAPRIELVPLIICAARRMLGTSARAAASRSAERTDGV